MITENDKNAIGGSGGKGIFLAFCAMGLLPNRAARSASRFALYMAELNEQVAETAEALMEKFFMEEPFTAEELQTGIKAGILDRSVTPVFCGCAYTGSAPH